MGAPSAETELAGPLCGYLAAAGWKVRSEVNHCDVAAVRGADELLVVEIKRSLTLALVVQGVKRQRLTDTVYLAVPRPASTWRWRQENRGALHLLRRLELGLLFVSSEAGRPAVEAVLHPAPFTRRRRLDARQALLAEIGERSADYNTAGSRQRKLMTAYRERAVRIAACMLARGRLSARQLRGLGNSNDAWGMLYRNVYGWFDRVGDGLYELSARGRAELEGYAELRDRYLAEIGASRPRSPTVSSRRRRKP